MQVENLVSSAGDQTDPVMCLEPLLKHKLLMGWSDFEIRRLGKNRGRATKRELDDIRRLVLNDYGVPRCD